MVILEGLFPSLDLNTVFLNFNIKCVKVMTLVFILYVQHNVVIAGWGGGGKWSQPSHTHTHTHTHTHVTTVVQQMPIEG